jgi:hypothetical protein
MSFFSAVPKHAAVQPYICLFGLSVRIMSGSTGNTSRKPGLETIRYKRFAWRSLRCNECQALVPAVDATGTIRATRAAALELLDIAGRAPTPINKAPPRGRGHALGRDSTPGAAAAAGKARCGEPAEYERQSLRPRHDLTADLAAREQRRMNIEIGLFRQHSGKEHGFGTRDRTAVRADEHRGCRSSRASYRDRVECPAGHAQRKSGNELILRKNSGGKRDSNPRRPRAPTASAEGNDPLQVPEIPRFGHGFGRAT